MSHVTGEAETLSHSLNIFLYFSVWVQTQCSCLGTCFFLDSKCKHAVKSQLHINGRGWPLGWVNTHWLIKGKHKYWSYWDFTRNRRSKKIIVVKRNTAWKAQSGCSGHSLFSLHLFVCYNLTLLCGWLKINKQHKEDLPTDRLYHIHCLHQHQTLCR